MLDLGPFQNERTPKLLPKPSNEDFQNMQLLYKKLTVILLLAMPAVNIFSVLIIIMPHTNIRETKW